MAAQDKEIFEATEELYLEPGTKAPPNSPLLAAQAHHIHRLDLEQAAFAFPFETHGYDTSADTMVQLTEVVDEHFQESQPGPEDDDDYSDTGTFPSLPLHVARPRAHLLVRTWCQRCCFRRRMKG